VPAALGRRRRRLPRPGPDRPPRPGRPGPCQLRGTRLPRQPPGARGRRAAGLPDGPRRPRPGGPGRPRRAPGAVLDVVDDCAAKGVPALVVVTAGFAEAGPDGARLQEQLVERVRAAGMRLVGPNCLGLLNTDPDVRLNASFAPLFP